MIADFSDVKRLIRDTFDEFDHTFVIQQGDLFEAALRALDDRRYFVISHPPTAEVLACLWHGLLYRRMEGFLPPDFILDIRVWETSTNSVYVSAPLPFAVTIQGGGA